MEVQHNIVACKNLYLKGWDNDILSSDTDGNTILDDDEDKLNSKNDDDDIEVSMNSRTKVGRF
jgi:hypothetical protein